MPKKLKLEGLDCASCAYEIEEALKKEGFKFALVNFATKEAVIEEDIEKAKRIIKKVEPDVKVIDAEEHEHGHEHHHDEDEDPKKALYFITPSLMLFVIGIVLRYYYDMDNTFVFGIFTVSYLLVGWKVLRNAVINSIRGNVFDENFLIAIATLGAFAIREYPEAVGVMLFYVVGEFFQDLAVNRSRRSIKSLLALKAEYANLLVGDKVVQIKPEKLKVGDIILIKPGERVPVDGIIIQGTSNVDTSALTGESVPKTVREGDEILSGMLNLSGLLKVKVTKELRESTITRILELVENASARKAKTERFITKFARRYTPSVVALATLVAVIPPLAFGEPFSKWVYRALVLLVISCPCALLLCLLQVFSSFFKLPEAGRTAEEVDPVAVLVDYRLLHDFFSTVIALEGHLYFRFESFFSALKDWHYFEDFNARPLDDPLEIFHSIDSDFYEVLRACEAIYLDYLLEFIHLFWLFCSNNKGDHVMSSLKFWI